MRVLFITNFYPPCEYGWGYMQLCEEVADGLYSRGHDVAILTSSYRYGSETNRPYQVHRLLSIDPDWHSGKSAVWQFFFGRRHREKKAVADFLNLVVDFCPDLIFIWHAIGLSRTLFQAAENIPGVKVVYYLAGYLPELPDEYIAYWQAKPIRLVAKALKRPLSRIALRQLIKEGKPIELKYENVICVSDYVRQRLVSKGLIPTTSIVIHNGVNLSTFRSNGETEVLFKSQNVSCLIAGRVALEKGIHTAIDAFAALRADKKDCRRIELTILGDGPEHYLKYIKEKVRVNHLQDMVKFHPPIPREQMPEMLSKYDILILPSEYDEPIARAMQEAMAMGLLVIGTDTGGSGELLVHEKTGFVFEPGNPQFLADQIHKVQNNPGLARRIAEAGQEVVIENFNIENTMEKVEQYMYSLYKNS